MGQVLPLPPPPLPGEDANLHSGPQPLTAPTRRPYHGLSAHCAPGALVNQFLQQPYCGFRFGSAGLGI